MGGEKRPPAGKARRPTGARSVGLVHPHAQNQTFALRSRVRHSPAEQSNDQMTERIPLLVDTDTGVDDALALLMALADTRHEVVGLTIAAGNVGLSPKIGRASGQERGCQNR